jgi:2,4-dienoyl-CoA reductase-like NADH-dependent reductase (Old Yellow Enzyme family)
VLYGNLVSSLLEPLRFRNGVRARNRAWLAPMTNLQSHEDGQLSDDELAWLTMRARAGFGVVETCAAHVSRDGQGWPGELGVYDDHLRPGLDRLAAAIHEHGALGLVQLFHGGQRAPSSLTGQDPWSAVAGEFGEEHVRAATPEDIERVIADFRDAAVRTHAAGFAGVELHGAHGYVLCQFVAATNARADGWGCSLEGRARLLRETMRAVRGAVPESFVVGVRLSPEDYGTVRGLDLDESIEVARWLCEDGADFIHVSLWDAFKDTTKRPKEHALPLFRAALPRDVPVVVAGSVWTRAEADALLEKGASAIAVARAGIANPDWAARIGEPSWEPRRPPLSPAELAERGLSPRFVEYMRRWKGFVSP